MAKRKLRARRVLKDDFDKDDYNYEVEVTISIEAGSLDEEPTVKLLKSKVKIFPIRWKQSSGW